MKPSTFLTAGEASRATGKAIPTITRAVKNGKIAGSRKGVDGEYEIDPTALFNVYPPIDQTLGGKGDTKPQMLGDATPALEQALRDIIAEKDKTIERLEADKEKAFEEGEKWRLEYRESKQMLLTHEQKTAAMEPEIERLEADKEKALTEAEKWQAECNEAKEKLLALEAEAVEDEPPKKRWWQRRRTEAA